MNETARLLSAMALSAAIVACFSWYHIIRYGIQSPLLDSWTKNMVRTDIKSTSKNHLKGGPGGVVLEVVYGCCENIQSKKKEVVRLRNLLRNTPYNASLETIPCYELDGLLMSGKEREKIVGKKFLPEKAEIFRKRVWGGNVEKVLIQGVFCRDEKNRAITRPEVSNVWIDSLRRDLDNIVSAETAARFKFQNKALLHSALKNYSYGNILPKLYQSPAQIKRTDFPVVLKRSIGASGFGIFIVNSTEELASRMRVGNHTLKKDPRIALYQTGRSVGWIIEEAIVGGLEYIVHYLRTNSGRPFIKCTVYKKKKWQNEKLFVKGTFDRRPVPTPVKCNNQVVCMVLNVIEIEDIVGAGCVGFKIGADNVPKVFDWNMRQCGSLSPIAVKGMLTSPRNWTRMRESECKRPFV